MNVLVAGGAGYIGSVVTAVLVESGHDVAVLDNLSKGYRRAVHPDARFFEGDIADGELIRRICESGIDVAMHFAAFIEVNESVRNPSMYYDNNVARSIRFFDNLRACGVNRVVFSSTAAVYGDPESVPLTEDAPLRPVNTYGRTKLVVEQVLGDYDRAYGMRYAALRYFNAGGAYRDYGESHRPESHLIPLILDAALGNTELKVYGDDYDTRDGSCVRDYIHVKDLADAHILAAEYLAGGGSSESFNLGTGEGFTVLDVVKTAERVTGAKIEYRVVDRREGDTAVLVASPEKARRILGWGGKLSGLEEIMESAWKWKLRFPHGYEE